MQNFLSEEKKKQNLLIAIWDGIFSAINVGCGETYMPVFAIALGAGNIQIGLLTSLPNLIAALSQLNTPQFVKAFESRKKLINIFVFLQVFMWFPILSIPFVSLKENQVVILIVLYALYLSFGSFILPAYGSLLSDSVVEAERGKYFSWRGKLIGISTVLSGFIGGFILYKYSASVYAGFAMIFGLAAFARLVSNFFLFKLHEFPLKMAQDHYFSFLDFARRLPVSNFAKYVFYIGFFHTAAYLAGPYFSVLMLRDFGFSYLTYAILTTVANVSSLLGLTYWGRHSDEFGNARLFKISAVLISFIPLLWFVSHQVWYLFLIQLVAGYLWGGFNLCCANFIYDASIPEKRVYCISYYNVVVGLGIFVGTLLGGYLSNHLPPFLGYRIFSVLLMSSLCRMIVAWFLLPRVNEVRHVKHITRRDLFLRIMGLNTSSEGIER